MKRTADILGIILALLLSGCATKTSSPALTAPQMRVIDAFTLHAPNHLVKAWDAMNPDGSLNVVVEIPAGTNDKWEVSKDGHLLWEFKNGKPRVVHYLSYPANYGMIPSTANPERIGGDGDPLDAVVLGPAIPRGTIVRTRLIGVLKLIDTGEKDDKLVTVPLNGIFQDVQDLQQLQRDFPGAADVLSAWFANYKGKGKIKIVGYGDANEAKEILDVCNEAFNKEK